MTDKELEKIYNEAYRAVYWTAMSLLKNEADAEDIVQDTFVTLIESYDTLVDKNKVVPWLKKIAANKSLNRLTRTKTDVVPDEFFEDVEATPEDFLPDSIVESEETRKIIMDIISNTLSEDIRRTLILFYFDEMSTKEIAEALSVPDGTVRRRLNFARNKIKKEVEKYEEENKTKLFGMPVPFLTQLFMKEAEQVPFRTMPASLKVTLSASSQASQAGAAAKAVASATEKGIGIMMKKAVVGSIIGVVTVGLTVGTILVVTSKKDTKSKNKKKHETEIEEKDKNEHIDLGDVEEAGADESQDDGILPVEEGITGYCAVGKITTICGVYEFKDTVGEFIDELKNDDQLRLVISDYDGNKYTVDDLDTVVTSKYLGVNVYMGDYDRLFEFDVEDVEGTAIRDCKITNFLTSAGTISVEVAGHVLEIGKTTIDEAVEMLGDFYTPRTPTEESLNSYSFDLSHYELNHYRWAGNDDGTIDFLSVSQASFLY